MAHEELQLRGLGHRENFSTNSVCGSSFGNYSGGKFAWLPVGRQMLDFGHDFIGIEIAGDRQ